MFSTFQETVWSHLKHAGKTPEVSDAFISLVIGPVRASTDCLTTCVGMGSSTQDLGLQCTRRFLIALSDAVINSLNVHWKEGRSVVTDIFMGDRLELCRLSLSIWIFEEK